MKYGEYKKLEDPSNLIDEELGMFLIEDSKILNERALDEVYSKISQYSDEENKPEPKK